MQWLEEKSAMRSDTIQGIKSEKLHKNRSKHRYRKQAHTAVILYDKARPAAATTENDRVIETPWFAMGTFLPDWGIFSFV
jgi:hypothetical protein